MSSLAERAARTATVTGARIRSLQGAYRRNESGAVGDLARLRRAVGTEIDDDLAIMGIAFDGSDEDLFDDVPQADTPLPEERAFFASVTLYALHQQSHHDKSMHHGGYSLGRSARLLQRRLDRASTRARFTALGTSVTWDETLQHARGLVQQLRQAGIPLDYARFARDLFDLQSGRADRVRLGWGRDFYRVTTSDDDTADTSSD
ncbi:type I-E CRISPR-associated protein Cse2/CasB [Microbacterium suaedae]|uniref:type I-E CRISPR-associated protein Cse2/CasB n=1 Tax=Microbacterium suaedae TaxID=2067813 RepID=UPI000DA13D94|nr:type I-E CRISPR-associated protein Cse2/CasB [Microbacterium suaedae]